MRRYLQKFFIRFLVKDIFHTISKEDILRTNKKGIVEWKGKELDPAVWMALKTQASNFKDSTLWTVLKAELQWSAAKTLLEKGSSEMDIRVAQIQGYLTRVIDEKLEDLTS